MPVTTTARPQGHPGYSETLKRASESPEAARHLVRRALSAWGLEHLTDDGTLVVSELVTNAVRHTPSRLIRVTITRPTPGVVRIDVVDRSHKRPERRQPDEDERPERGHRDRRPGRHLRAPPALRARQRVDRRPDEVFTVTLPREKHQHSIPPER